MHSNSMFSHNQEVVTVLLCSRIMVKVVSKIHGFKSDDQSQYLVMPAEQLPFLTCLAGSFRCIFGSSIICLFADLREVAPFFNFVSGNVTDHAFPLFVKSMLGFSLNVPSDAVVLCRHVLSGIVLDSSCLSHRCQKLHWLVSIITFSICDLQISV